MAIIDTGPPYRFWPGRRIVGVGWASGVFVYVHVIAKYNKGELGSRTVALSITPKGAKVGGKVLATKTFNEATGVPETEGAKYTLFRALMKFARPPKDLSAAFSVKLSGSEEFEDTPGPPVPDGTICGAESDHNVNTWHLANPIEESGLTIWQEWLRFQSNYSDPNGGISSSGDGFTGRTVIDTSGYPRTEKFDRDEYTLWGPPPASSRFHGVIPYIQLTSSSLGDDDQHRDSRGRLVGLPKRPCDPTKPVGPSKHKEGFFQIFVEVWPIKGYEAKKPVAQWEKKFNGIDLITAKIVKPVVPPAKPVAPPAAIGGFLFQAKVDRTVVSTSDAGVQTKEDLFDGDYDWSLAKMAFAKLPPPPPPVPPIVPPLPFIVLGAFPRTLTLTQYTFKVGHYTLRLQTTKDDKDGKVIGDPYVVYTPSPEINLIPTGSSPPLQQDFFEP